MPHQYYPSKDGDISWQNIYWVLLPATKEKSLNHQSVAVHFFFKCKIKPFSFKCKLLRKRWCSFNCLTLDWRVEVVISNQKDNKQTKILLHMKCTKFPYFYAFFPWSSFVSFPQTLIRDKDSSCLIGHSRPDCMKWWCKISLTNMSKPMGDHCKK